MTDATGIYSVQQTCGGGYRGWGRSGRFWYKKRGYSRKGNTVDCYRECEGKEFAAGIGYEEEGEWDDRGSGGTEIKEDVEGAGY